MDRSAFSERVWRPIHLPSARRILFLPQMPVLGVLGVSVCDVFVESACEAREADRPASRRFDRASRRVLLTMQVPEHTQLQVIEIASHSHHLMDGQEATRSY